MSNEEKENQERQEREIKAVLKSKEIVESYEPELKALWKKIRSNNLANFLTIYKSTLTIAEIVLSMDDASYKEYGTFGLDEKHGRPTTKGLKKLMQYKGWKNVSDRTVRDYAYAIHYLNRVLQMYSEQTNALVEGIRLGRYS